MKAVVSNPDVRGWLELGDVAAPAADSNQALVRVTAFSLNRGEVKRAESYAAGTQIGWDLVGVIEEAARDGSGPQAGARVVGLSLAMRGWAEQVAVPTNALAVVPDGVSDADAATLPVAGLTALYALERCERVLANRVLVTGASGGVGYFACQLARLMGADVVAQIRSPVHATMVRETGATEVVVTSDGAGLEREAPFRYVIDGVGGPLLSAALKRLEQSGRAVIYGVTAGPESALPVREVMFTGDGGIEGFHLYRESEIEAASKGLARLLALLADRRLKTHVAETGGWSRIGEVAEGLIERRFLGKAVLLIEG